MKPDGPDPAMEKARQLAEKSGRSLQEIGQAMGYPAETARKSAWQFLNQTNDPRLGMLRRFADAMGVKVRDLV